MNKPVAARKALVVGTQHWRSPFRVGSHHIAAALQERDYAVCYVSAPVTPLHLANWVDRRDLCVRFQQVWRPARGTGILNVVPFAMIAPDKRPILRTSGIVLNWWRSAVPPLRSLVKRHGFDNVDVLYLDNPYQGFWPKMVSHRRFVFRVPDDISGFKGVGKSVVAEQQRLSREADCVVFSGHELRRRFHGVDAGRAITVPNGVDLEYFREARHRPAEYHDLNRPIAIYVGALDGWFDAELVKECAARCRDVSFVIVGPPGPGAHVLNGLSNVTLLGPKPYEEVVALLQHADVGLIPFDVRKYRHLIDAVHPLKLYEYMAAGLPVVAVRWAEMNFIDPPVELVEQYADDFSEGIQRACRQGFSSSAYKRFLSGASWSERLCPLFRRLEL